MKSSDYQSYDGLGLAELLRAGEVSPVELMTCAIELAESRGATCNALIHARFEAALDRAAASPLKGPFGALPFLLKDSGLASTFLPTSMGSRMFAGMTSKLESTLSERFIAAGLQAFARTTVPELNMAPTTEAVKNGGPTRNPWDLGRSSGGSSGGAAVAVASGIVPIAHGSDGGGSIRIPASCCGVFGLKPSRGVMPFGPVRGEGWGGLATDGVLTRTVRDTAAVMDAVAGMDAGAPYAAPAKPDSYQSSLGKPFARPQRIAIWTESFDDIPVAPECLLAVRRAESLLQYLGHETVDMPAPQLNYASFIDSIIDVMASNVAVMVNGFLRQNPEHDPQRELEPAIYEAYRIGKELSAEKYVLAINRFHGISRLMAKHMDQVDFILSPTLTQLPLPLGALSTSDDFPSFRRKAARYTAFLAIINASGQPAANLPLHWAENGLPVGVQLIGHFGADADTLRLSAHIESLAKWTERRPKVAN